LSIWLKKSGSDKKTKRKGKLKRLPDTRQLGVLKTERKNASIKDRGKLKKRRTLLESGPLKKSKLAKGVTGAVRKSDQGAFWLSGTT